MNQTSQGLGAQVKRPNLIWDARGFRWGAQHPPTALLAAAQERRRKLLPGALSSRSPRWSRPSSAPTGPAVQCQRVTGSRPVRCAPRHTPARAARPSSHIPNHPRALRVRSARRTRRCRSLAPRAAKLPWTGGGVHRKLGKVAAKRETRM